MQRYEKFLDFSSIILCKTKRVPGFEVGRPQAE